MNSCSINSFLTSVKKLHSTHAASRPYCMYFAANEPRLRVHSCQPIFKFLREDPKSKAIRDERS